LPIWRLSISHAIGRIHVGIDSRASLIGRLLSRHAC
jgi:hypothetical protein